MLWHCWACRMHRWKLLASARKSLLPRRTRKKCTRKIAVLNCGTANAHRCDRQTREIPVGPLLAGLFASVSNAAVFEDGEARRAILNSPACGSRAAATERQRTAPPRYPSNFAASCWDTPNQDRGAAVRQAKLRARMSLIRDVPDLQRHKKTSPKG